MILYFLLRFFYYYFLLYLGSCCVDKNPQQHVPLQEYSENLKEITRHLASAGVSADKVILITPPPLHEPAWEKECILKGNTQTLFLSCTFK